MNDIQIRETHLEMVEIRERIERDKSRLWELSNRWVGTQDELEPKKKLIQAIVKIIHKSRYTATITNGMREHKIQSRPDLDVMILSINHALKDRFNNPYSYELIIQHGSKF